MNRQDKNGLVGFGIGGVVGLLMAAGFGIYDMIRYQISSPGPPNVIIIVGCALVGGCMGMMITPINNGEEANG